MVRETRQIETTENRKKLPGVSEIYNHGILSGLHERKKPQENTERRSQKLEEHPNTAPRPAQESREAPRPSEAWPSLGPRRARDNPKNARDRPKKPQDRPKTKSAIDTFLVHKNAHTYAAPKGPRRVLRPSPDFCSRPVPLPHTQTHALLLYEASYQTPFA